MDLPDQRSQVNKSIINEGFVLIVATVPTTPYWPNTEAENQLPFLICLYHWFSYTQSTFLIYVACLALVGIWVCVSKVPTSLMV